MPLRVPTYEDGCLVSPLLDYFVDPVQSKNCKFFSNVRLVRCSEELEGRIFHAAIGTMVHLSIDRSFIHAFGADVIVRLHCEHPRYILCNGWPVEVLHYMSIIVQIADVLTRPRSVRCHGSSKSQPQSMRCTVTP